MRTRRAQAMPRGGSRATRAELAERLRERRGEIEEALLTRTYAIADPKEAADPEYAQGLRAAVSAALEYGLEAVEHGEKRRPPAPVLLLAQARLAARNRVSLDTVLRRYFAGYTVLGDFIVEEAGGLDLGEAGLKHLLRDQAVLFERFLTIVSEEYGREARRPRSSEDRKAERIERLLAGERAEAAELAYELSSWHTAVLVVGGNAEDAIRQAATKLDAVVLAVRREGGIVWAWFGSRRRIDPEVLRSSLRSQSDLRLAIGEPGEGIRGWRLSHRQATAALPVALRSAEKMVRYADVALLAAAIQDELLATSLRQLYLDPLAAERDGGEILRGTLRAYFAAEQNISSAAVALGVTRQTVNNRLRAVKQRIGRPLPAFSAEVEVALSLAALYRL